MARHPDDPIEHGPSEYPTKFVAADSTVIEVPKAALFVWRDRLAVFPDQFEWSIYVTGELAAKFVEGTEYRVSMLDEQQRRTWNGVASCASVRQENGEYRADFKKVSQYQEWTSLPPKPGDPPKDGDVEPTDQGSNCG